MLKACLAASRTRLTQHLLDQPQSAALPGQTGEMEKEELKNALVLTQESAAIQVLQGVYSKRKIRQRIEMKTKRITHSIDSS